MGVISEITLPGIFAGVVLCVFVIKLWSRFGERLLKFFKKTDDV